MSNGSSSRPARSFFCSWSGGKDSALALHRAAADTGTPTDLLTMMIEDGSRSRSHGLRRTVLRAQARSLGLTLRLVPASWNNYETEFGAALADLRSEGKDVGVYGDIDIAAHRSWVEQISTRHDTTAVLPLWGSDRHTLLEEFFRLGLRARIIAVRTDALSKLMLGREFDESVCTELARSGSDLSGENGEYHTVVYDGPLFTRPLHLTSLGTVERDGYWFQDVRTN